MTSSQQINLTENTQSGNEAVETHTQLHIKTATLDSCAYYLLNGYSKYYLLIN